MNMATRTQREEFTMVAILKQLEIAGVDPTVLSQDKEWFSNNTITKEQHDEWKKWFIAEARKTFKMNKKLVEREFQWFNLSYGLRDADPIK
jgi:hypothetical protein